MSLLGKKFPAPVGMSIDPDNFCVRLEGNANINAAKPMLPFYAAGMTSHLGNN